MIADLPFGAVVVVRIAGQPDRVDRIDAVHLEDLERIAGEHAALCEAAGAGRWSVSIVFDDGDAFELVTGP